MNPLTSPSRSWYITSASEFRIEPSRGWRPPRPSSTSCWDFPRNFTAEFWGQIFNCFFLFLFLSLSLSLSLFLSLFFSVSLSLSFSLCLSVSVCLSLSLFLSLSFFLSFLLSLSRDLRPPRRSSTSLMTCGKNHNKNYTYINYSWNVKWII